MTHEVPVFCAKDCGGNACPLLVTIEDGRAVRLRDNPAGAPWIRPCPRGHALHREHYAPNRLTTPLVLDGPRGSGRFRDATWDEALDLVAAKIRGIRARHGGSAILAMGGSGNLGGFHGTRRLVERFLNASRPESGGDDPGPPTFMSSGYSNGAVRFVLPYLYGAAGGESGWDAATVRHSRLIVLWGANILEARLGAELGLRVAEAARSGVPVVVIDPRRSPTAKAVGARWIPIKPATDAAMMLAVLHVLYTRGRVDRERVSELAVGMDDLEAYVSGRLDGVVRDPAWAESICGVPAGEIASFAELYAAHTPTMLIPGYSIQRVAAGEQTFRLTAALQIATENFGVPGGSTGSMNNALPGPKLGALDSFRRGDEPSFPVVRWPDAILEGRAGGYPSDIKMAYIAGSNYVNQGADIKKNVRAMKALEFAVCHETFMTSTAELCDVVLPVASALELEDIGKPWAGNYLLYKPCALAPAPGTMDDYSIFCTLSDRLGFGERFHANRSASEWIESILAESEIPDIEAFKATGLYIASDQERVGLSIFVSAPSDHPLPTPSGKVEIRSVSYAAETGGSAFPIWENPTPDADHPFLLVTPKTIARTHSQNGARAAWPPVRPVTPRPTDAVRRDTGELTMHPDDARALGIHAGDRVSVSNARGSLLARAAISDDIRTGVVCLHEGVWHAVRSDGVDTAGSANVLTATDGTFPGIAPIMHGIPVAINVSPGRDSL